MIGSIAALAILCPFLAGAVGMLFGRRLPPGAVAVVGTALGALVTLVLVAAVLAHPGQRWETTTLLTPTGSVPLTVGMRVEISFPVGKI